MNKKDDPILLNAMTEEEARLRIVKIRQLIGVTSLEMKGSPAVAIIGPAPMKGTLPEDKMIVLPTPAGVNPEVFSSLSEYVSHLVQCVQFAAPNARFIFIPVRLDSKIQSDLPATISRLTASGNKPGIL